MDESVRCWRRVKYCLLISVHRGEIDSKRASQFMEDFMNLDADSIQEDERFFEDEFGFPLWPDGRPDDRTGIANEWKRGER
tara:strand:- start:575 stop:817 length:243 start_codon:yes stop_codon:yes gene_type:complete